MGLTDARVMTNLVNRKDALTSWDEVMDRGYTWNHLQQYTWEQVKRIMGG